MAISWPTDWAPKPSISWLSYNMFDECERKWLNNYHGDIVSEQVAIQAKLMPLGTLAGRVVDDTITFFLRSGKAGNPWPENMYPHAKARLKQYVQHSRNWRTAMIAGQPCWPEAEEQPLDAYYFEEPPDKARQEIILETIQTCIKNFESSVVLQFILAHDPTNWIIRPSKLPNSKKQQPIPWHAFSEVPVYASFDFALKAADFVVIFDWKCGDIEYDRGKALEQLHWYAAYFADAWSIPIESLRLSPVWLATDPQFDLYDVEPHRLSFARKMWTDRFTVLQDRITDCGSDRVRLLQSFPITTEPRRCKYCQFRDCPGFGRPLDNSE